MHSSFLFFSALSDSAAVWIIWITKKQMRVRVSLSGHMKMYLLVVTSKIVTVMLVCFFLYSLHSYIPPSHFSFFPFYTKVVSSGNSSSESESSSESDTDESESSSTDSEYNRASRTHTPEVGWHVWIGVLMCRLCNCIRMDNISNTDFKIILSCKKTSQFKLFWKK